MGLRFSYTCIAPFYDRVVAKATLKARSMSLQHLPQEPGRVLIAGVGTGLDAPFLPPQHEYVGLDLTRAMLTKALPPMTQLSFLPVQGNVHHLPFPDACFDHVVLHLILAVVPHPARCLQEATRVVRPGGTLLVLDKFLKPGQKAPLRRLITPLMGQVASRLDVVFEEVMAQAPELRLEDDQPALAGGWFRHIRLIKD